MNGTILLTAIAPLVTRLRHAETKSSRAESGGRNDRSRREKSCSNNMQRRMMPRLPNRVDKGLGWCGCGDDYAVLINIFSPMIILSVLAE